MAILNPKDRETIDAIGDAIIPTAEGMPSASEAGATGVHLDRVLSLRPDLRESVLHAARSVANVARENAAKALLATDPDVFTVVGEAIAAAYYMSPEVRRLIGYPGQERREIPEDDDLSQHAKDMLRRVVERGPIYRNI
ncbi:MAG: hypothetical protein ACLQB4_18125 [Beijerinckiaceae bacterium]